MRIALFILVESSTVTILNVVPKFIRLRRILKKRKKVNAAIDYYAAPSVDRRTRKKVSH